MGHRPSATYSTALRRRRASSAYRAAPSASTAPFNHSADARFDDAVLADGAALYAELALRRLSAVE